MAFHCCLCCALIGINLYELIKFNNNIITITVETIFEA